MYEPYINRMEGVVGSPREEGAWCQDNYSPVNTCTINIAIDEVNEHVCIRTPNHMRTRTRTLTVAVGEVNENNGCEKIIAMYHNLGRIVWTDLPMAADDMCSQIILKEGHAWFDHPPEIRIRI